MICKAREDNAVRMSVYVWSGDNRMGQNAPVPPANAIPLLHFLLFLQLHFSFIHLIVKTSESYSRLAWHRLGKILFFTL